MMSKTVSALIFAMCITLGVVSANFSRADDKAPTTQPAKADNTKCPVTGEDIDPSVTTVYKGKTVAFCCKDCVKKFNDNPEKYVDKK